MPTLWIEHDGQVTAYPFAGTPLLAEALEQAGFAVFRPCGGRGVCRKCAADASGALSEPNAAERRAGCRLACQAVLLGDCRVRLPQARAMEIETSGDAALSVFQPLGEGFGAALDIGTTTMALKVYDLQSGACLGQAALPNPQAEAGADVMSRIGAAMAGGLGRLQKQVHVALDALLAQACGTRRPGPQDVRTLVVAGNTTMLYLFDGRSPESLSHAPFQADCLFDQWRDGKRRRAYLPACMNAFVGADMTCAVLASGMCRRSGTALLCDIGTNGEIALWKDAKLYVTSTAAGPAFEGAGISCGMGSVRGAIDRVWTEDAELRVRTIGEAPAAGLCGSGLIDAVASLLALKKVDETGAMKSERVFLAEGVALLPGDIRAVQLAKAAIAAGIQTVLEMANATPEAVEDFFIAGGFGNHLNLSSASAIGLIPRALVSRAHIIGNGALTGAARVLLDARELEESRRIAALSVHVDLGGNPLFNEHYMNHMLFEQDGEV